MPPAAAPSVGRERLASYRRAFKGWHGSFTFVDLGAFDRNAAALSRRSGGKPIRVASRSVRVVELLRRVLNSSPAYQGVLCDDYFTRAEQIFLARGGWPHWGQGYTLSASDFAAMVPRFQEFLTLRNEDDPQRRFTNASLERVLGD